MDNFWFYIQLGLEHVLDFGAYDHILFLAALAIPFRFPDWKKVIILATIFTVTHCVALGLSVFDVMTVDVGLIEFLIPVTIFLTALFNIFMAVTNRFDARLGLHLLATAFFGFVHGFGFSNYFKMMMADSTEKLVPLLGFATGIELSQVCIILGALVVGYVGLTLFKLPRKYYVIAASVLILLITLPMLHDTYPW